ncbi:MAG: glycosyltransferase family A protein [Acidimicrobiia bacterium]
MGQTHRFGRSPLLGIFGSGASEIRLSAKRIRARAAEPWEFVATPDAARDGWQVARSLDARTAPGDLIIADDRDGVAGLYALEQAMRPPQERRHVVVVAGESSTLERLWTGGTLDGEPADESMIDWEIVLYRFAEWVVTPSKAAAELLQAAGVRADVTVVDIAEPPLRDVPGHRSVRSIWLPEDQSRRAQTARIMRVLLGSVPDVRLVVSPESAQDRIWADTTRQVNGHLFDMFETRVDAGRRPLTDPDLVVLGDPFRLPAPSVGRLRDRGVPVVVYKGSTVASYWPESPTWSSEEELVGIVSGERIGEPAARPPRPGVDQALSLAPLGVEDGRARRVSVGVPIFRDVRFLDECLESIVAQTQPAEEVLLIDDGSLSAEVDAGLERWEALHPGLIRVLRQHNRGVCVARNTMLDAMRGDSFVLVDADDVLAHDFIEKTATALRAAPDLWAVATWTEFFGDYEGVEAKPPFDERVGRRENPIVSTCALVDMKVRDLGIRFDPELAFIYCEDWDFWSQIVAHGGKFGLVPDALARHRVHGSSGANVRTPLAHRIGKARANARMDGVPRVGVVHGREGR